MIIIKDKPTVKEMPEDSRPRERLYQYGASSLATRELLAIIIRTGTARQTALEVADQLISAFDNLEQLFSADVREMQQRVKGIGLVKAVQIKAALELGKRLLTEQRTRNAITCAEDVFLYLAPDMRYLEKEYFKVVLLDTKNNILGIKDISVGTLNSSLVHPREVFKEAIRLSSASLILVHNHPSGDPYPSKEDLAVTDLLYRAGELLGIKVLDHIIIGDNIYLSFKERNFMPCS